MATEAGICGAISYLGGYFGLSLYGFSASGIVAGSSAAAA